MVRIIRLLVVAFWVSGCSLVPNMDHGSSGCANAVGIGPRNVTEFAADRPVVPGLIGLAPLEAANRAAADGHTVVFNVPIANYGECWCVPPPEGEVTQAWWNEHGALYLMVEGVDEGHTADQQPPTGWGCV